MISHKILPHQILRSIALPALLLCGWFTAGSGALARPVPAASASMLALAPLPAAQDVSSDGQVEPESALERELGELEDQHLPADHDDHDHTEHGLLTHEKRVATASDLFNEIYLHIMPHWYNDYVSNHHVAQLIAAFLVLLAFGFLASCRRRNLRPIGRIQNCLEALVVFVRDEMVYGVMGRDAGRRYLPLFLTQFFMILVMNLFGILPSFGTPGHTAGFPTTATANISVTAGLAVMTFCVILFSGIKLHGFGGYVVGLAPTVDLGPGKFNAVMKKIVLGILYPIEFLGLLIKPMALSIRLFANMTGGHMALLTIYGLSFFALSMLAKGFSVPITAVALGFNIFLTFLEILVAFLQAYIFTYLSIIFVNASVHPEH